MYTSINCNWKSWWEKKGHLKDSSILHIRSKHGGKHIHTLPIGSIGTHCGN